MENRSPLMLFRSIRPASAQVNRQPDRHQYVFPLTAQEAASSPFSQSGLLTFFLLTSSFLIGYIHHVEWEVEFTYEFGQWWDGLSEAEQEDVDAKVELLRKFGPALRRPHSGWISSSRHTNMKEIIIQHAGRPYRVLYAFDPRRCAILLIGGDKTGDNRWYEKFVPVADRLLDEHLAALRKEGLTDG